MKQKEKKKKKKEKKRNVSLIKPKKLPVLSFMICIKKIYFLIILTFPSEIEEKNKI